MARYRLKSEEEIAWNAVRRAVTARVRLEAAAWTEKRLNDLLPPLQIEFQKVLHDGYLPQLEADYEVWVDDAISAMRRPQLEENGEDRSG